MAKTTALRELWNSREGRIYLTKRLLRRLGIRFKNFYLVVQPVPQRPLAGRLGRNVEIRAIAAEEYRYEWFPRPKVFIDDRFAQGARCWVAFKNGEAVGCIWIMPGAFRDDLARVRFVPQPEGETAWDFDVYIDERFRLGRLFGQLWDVASEWMREQGFRWTASRIEANNEASLRAHERLGARRSRHVVIVGAGPVEWVRVDGRARLNLSRSRWLDIPIPLPAELAEG